jgi:hypothetical protein
MRACAERLHAVQDDPVDEHSDGFGLEDCVRLARHCLGVGRVADAVAWYRHGIDRAPTADDPRNGPRSQAAAAAVRAAAESEVDAATRSAWRQRANRWLRDDLVDRETKWPRSDTATQRVLVRYARLWLSDPHLAPVRDAGFLLELPAGEREAWLQLWHDLDVWLRRVDPQ